MKVLHVSTQDFGGAGKSAYRLHLGLKSIGLDSRMLVMASRSQGPDVLTFARNENLISKTLRRVRAKLINREFDSYRRSRPQNADYFSDDRTVYRISRHPLVAESDIIHLHWVAGMMDYTELFAHILNKPLVWTLHDMNPFTGGCHYSGSCTKYEKACGACPQLGSQDENDLSSRIWRRKIKSYTGHSIQIVTASRWLKECVKKSSLFKNFKAEDIPYGISSVIFNKHDRKASRKLLGLPQDKTILLFGADYDVERKGLKYLIQALRSLELDKNNIALAIFGNCSYKLNQDAKLPVYRLGYIHDESILSSCYSAADLFIIPSIEDNFPNTVLESFACATTVVGFATGGIVDMIKIGQTGLLVESKNIAELSRHIEWMIKNPQEREKMGLEARKLVEKEYSLEAQAEKYHHLYNSMLI